MTALGLPLRCLPSRADACWLLGAVVGGLVVGALASTGYSLLVLAGVICALLTAYRWPYAMPFVLIVACAVYLGVFLTYRVQVGAFPLSVLNVLPVLVLVAAIAVPRQERGPPVLGRPASVPAALLAAGLLIGSIVGYANGAATYQLLRIDITEVSLLLGCLAGLLAGGSISWQRAIVRAFYFAALVAAAQQIVSFLYLFAVGHSLWQGLPFGGDVANLNQALSSGSVAGTRDNNLATFIMLPALTLAVYRLTTRDVFVSSLLMLAMAMSLSRSMWIAAVIALALALAARARSGRMLHPARVLKIGLVCLAVGATLSGVTGQVVIARLAQTGNEQDISLTLRQAESVQALRAVTSSAQNSIVGIGAGVLLPPTAALIQFRGTDRVAVRDRSSVLENQLLARWVNFGLLSVVGTIALLLGAGYAAFTALAKQRSSVDHDLMAVGLSLPPLLFVSPFSGTLLQLNLSLPFWLLAGTILAALWRAKVGRSAEGRISQARVSRRRVSSNTRNAPIGRG